VAINLGWRVREHGLRVAYWISEPGEEGEVVLPWRLGEQSGAGVNGWDKVNDLASIRDKLFNAIKVKLALWLKDARMPDRLKEETQTLAGWRAKGRLASIVRSWERCTGDDEIYAALITWRQKDKHLWEWEEHQRQSNRAWRTDCYRTVALDLARRFGAVVAADVSWADLMARPTAEKDNSLQARYYHRIAACGSLELLLRETFGEHWQVLKAQNLTRTCHHCGHLCTVGAELEHTCENCQAVWDQDANHCRNLLDAARGKVVDKARYSLATRKR
jgi:transposase